MRRLVRVGQQMREVGLRKNVVPPDFVEQTLRRGGRQPAAGIGGLTMAAAQAMLNAAFVAYEDLKRSRK